MGANEIARAKDGIVQAALHWRLAELNEVFSSVGMRERDEAAKLSCQAHCDLVEAIEVFRKAVR